MTYTGFYKSLMQRFIKGEPLLAPPAAFKISSIMKKSSFLLIPSLLILSSCAPAIGGETSEMLTSSFPATSIAPSLSYEVTPLEIGERIKLGRYPSSHVSDGRLLAALEKLEPDENGIYSYGGESYIKEKASPWNQFIQQEFHDEEKVVSGTDYWYQLEEIPWIVTQKENGIYSLISEYILDTVIFGGSSNNYEESSIRKWLNEDFRSLAFSKNSYFLCADEVDNSASSTDDESNAYVCENTYDEVYLPSYKELKDLGWANSLKGQAEATDYVIAKGAYCDQDNAMSYGDKVAMYWTRSPNSADNKRVTCIMAEGTVMTSGYDTTGVGVRPCIHAKF